MDIRYPHLTGYQVISLLLLTLIGLFLGVVSFASFGILNVTQEPITLLTVAINKLDHIQNHQDENDAKNQVWRNMMVNDHLFLAGMTAMKKHELDLVAEKLGVNVSDLDIRIINGTDLAIGTNLSVPVPPSAMTEFKRNQKMQRGELFDPFNSTIMDMNLNYKDLDKQKIQLEISPSPFIRNNFS